MPGVVYTPPAVPVRTPLQYDGSYNGLYWGPFTDIHLVSMTGLTGAPSVRVADVVRPGSDGAWYGRDLYSPRIVTLVFNLIPLLPGSTFESLMQQFEQALVVQRTNTLPLTLNGGSRILNCRPVVWDLPISAEHLNRGITTTTGGGVGIGRHSFGVATVQFRANDPFIYDATETVLSLSMQTPAGGWTFPWTFPWTFGVGGSPGTTQVEVTGSIETPPWFRITGPIDTGFQLLNMTTGAYLQVAMSLSDTDWVDIDMGLETVLFQSAADRRNAVVAGTNFWLLPPGINTIRLSPLGATSTGAGTMRMRNAYVSLRA